MHWREGIKLMLEREPCVKLRLSRPPSVNTGYERKDGMEMHKTQFHKDWIKQARLEMWGQRYELFTVPVAVIYEFPKKHAVEDCANFEKALSDFLVRQKVLQDDSLIWFNAQTWGNSRDCLINIFRL